MIKLPTLFWLIVVATAGFAMFAVKYEVQALADQLARTAKQADDTERSIRALEAEWAYLNRPDALAQMNQRLLSLIPIATKQLRADVTDIPMRPVPPPPPTWRRPKPSPQTIRQHRLRKPPRARRRNRCGTKSAAHAEPSGTEPAASRPADRGPATGRDRGA